MKKQKPDDELLQINISELQESFLRWEYLYQNGGQDPFWSDGCNLYLVRNHIFYYKGKIKEICEESGLSLPEIYFKEEPPEVDRNYYAKHDEIVNKSKEIIKQVEQNINLTEFDKDGDFIRSFRQYKQALADDELCCVKRYNYQPDGIIIYEYFVKLAEESKIKQSKDGKQLTLF